MVNPYQSPGTQANTSAAPARRWDPGVILIAVLFLVASVATLLGFVIPSIREFLMPRFGWIGSFLGMNSLIFIGMWMVAPTRRALLAASFVTLAIGIINACVLLSVGTVENVVNVFHDRVHSAWLWSVASYLLASVYMLFTAVRVSQDDTGPPKNDN